MSYCWIVLAPLLSASALMGGVDAVAQTQNDDQERSARRFSLVLGVGATAGGPGGSLDAQLREAGFGDARPPLCLPPP